MTNDNIKKLIEYTIEQSYESKVLVYQAIKELVNPFPRDIKKYLDDMARKRVKEEEQRSELPYSEDEFENKVKDRTIVMRTILRKLNELEQNKLIVKKEGRYLLSDTVLSNIKYYGGELFGRYAVSAIKHYHGHYPYLTFEENFNALIDIFGAYLMFCFIEAARPITDNYNGRGDGNSHGNSNHLKDISKQRPSMTNYEKDKLASSWIKEVIDPFGLYTLFIDVFKNQLDDDQVKLIRKRKVPLWKIPTKSFASVHPGPVQYSGNRHERLLGEAPYYELDKKTVLRLIRLFKREIPSVFEALLSARGGILFKPKEAAVPEIRQKIRACNIWEADEDKSRSDS